MFTVIKLKKVPTYFMYKLYQKERNLRNRWTQRKRDGEKGLRLADKVPAVHIM